MRYLESATLYQDSKVITYSPNDQTTVSFKPDKKSFSIHIVSQSNGDVQLNADTKTFKLIKNTKGPGTMFQRIYSFIGELKTTNGRQATKLDCILDYEL